MEPPTRRAHRHADALRRTLGVLDDIRVPAVLPGETRDDTPPAAPHTGRTTLFYRGSRVVVDTGHIDTDTWETAVMTGPHRGELTATLLWRYHSPAAALCGHRHISSAVRRAVARLRAGT